MSVPNIGTVAKPQAAMMRTETTSSATQIRGRRHQG
jgi:hypothetical protein